MNRLTGKCALVTGASAGIGRAIAIRFAQEGARVAINYPDAAELAGAQETRGVCPGDGHIVVEADVSNEAQVKAMFAQAIAQFGRLDILANNAGILGSTAASHEMDAAEFDRVMGVNLRGAFLCSREALRHFVEHGVRGAIVSNSSCHQAIPKPAYLPYSVSKGAMDNLTRTLALEYAARGIRVNAVGPGAIVTRMNLGWTTNDVARAGVEEHIPLGRAAEASEIAAVFAFLASDDASYVTGQTIHACGGLTLYPEFRTAWASEGSVK